MKNCFNFKIFILFLSGFIFSQEIDLNNINFANLDEKELQKYIELTQKGNSELNDQIPNQETLMEVSEENQDSDSKEDKDKIEEARIFGHDYINTIPTTISATTDLPVPGEYKMSLGDKLRILFSGSKDDIFTATVQLDGTIILPEIGKILILGKNFNETQKIIEELINSSYVGVNVNISLAELNAKKISIIGAVKYPGVYLVNPFTTVSNALAYAGGVMNHASLRAITIISPDGRTAVFDLYDLLIKGDRTKDFNISAGDTIKVGGTNSLVKIHGSVIRPKIYEYKQNDSFADLIDFALGLSRNGNDRNITATINENGRKLTKKINKDSLIRNQDVEALYIGNSVIVDSQDVFVSGNSVTSGFYASSNEKLTKFLDKIRFSSEIYPFYAIYKNTSADGLARSISSFSLSDPESYSNLSAAKNTELSFFSRDEILNIDQILDEDLKNTELSFFSRDEILNIDQIGEALREINQDDFISISFPDRSFRIPAKGKITPKQIHAYFESIGEIDPKKVSVVTSKNTFTNAYEKFFNSEDLVAISFPSIKNENLIEVSIQGEVFSPGIYSVSSSTKLSDLYVLSGGLRNNAFENGISLFREDVKQKQIKAIREAKSVLTDAMIQKSTSISEGSMMDIQAIIELADLIEPNGRVAGEFYESSETTKNFTLKDGDSIVIPSMSYEVVVQGEVLNSSSFIFDKSMSYKDYIQAAGGFSDYADKRSVFIIKSNGLSVLAGSSVFSGQEKIEPGDTIVVPRNLDQLEPLPLISMATKIIADIAFSAASLNAIQD